jgi:hypothetical protein
MDEKTKCIDTTFNVDSDAMAKTLTSTARP